MGAFHDGSSDIVGSSSQSVVLGASQINSRERNPTGEFASVLSGIGHQKIQARGAWTVAYCVCMQFLSLESWQVRPSLGVPLIEFFFIGTLEQKEGMHRLQTGLVSD